MSNEYTVAPNFAQWARLKGVALKVDEDARAEQESQEKCSWEEIGNKPSEFTPSTHKHKLADVTDYKAPDLSKYATINKLSSVKQELQSEIRNEVTNLVNGAPEALNTLKELSDAFGENKNGVADVLAKVGEIKASLNDYALKSELPVLPEDHVTVEDLENVKATIPSIEGLASETFVKEQIATIDHTTFATKVELEEAVKDTVKYEEFTYNGETRKTVQLANYDSISGVSTTGEGHNLVMLSKWDVADFGATGVHLNLNTKDTVTINDNDVVATNAYVDEKVGGIVIPDVSNFATREEVNTAKNEAIVACSGDAAAKYATIEAMEEVRASIPTIPSHDHLATKVDVATAINNIVRYSDVSGTSGIYKTVQLGNKDTVSVTSSSNERHDVLSISKRNDVQIGSANLNININVRDSITVNNNDTVATTSFVNNKISQLQIPDTAIFATHGEVQDAVLAANSDAASKYATIATVEAVKNSIPTHDNFATKQELEDLKAIVPALPENHVNKEELKAAIDEVEAKIPSIPTDHVTVEELAAAIFRINTLESKVSDLSKTNVVPVIAGAATTVSEPEADLIIAASETPITAKTTYTGKSVEVKSMNVESAKVVMKALDGDLAISGYTSNGSIDGKVVEIEAYSGEHVKITDCVLGQGGYNAINIGNTKTTIDEAPKSILIDNVKLNGVMSNNAINIYGQKENAVITISNCHFAGVSNPVRLFNVTNTACTVNFINCTVDAWEADASEYMYAGFLLCEDATSATTEEEVNNNRFSKDKITVNFINCTGPHGKIVDADPSTFCGVANEKQLVYVFRHKLYKYELAIDANNAIAGILPYGDGTQYPTINIK